MPGAAEDCSGSARDPAGILPPVLRRTIASCCATIALLAAPATAGAQLSPPSGGSYGAPAPEVDAAGCPSGCRPGTILRFRGKGLADVEAVSFLGSLMPGDEVPAEPLSVSRGRAAVEIPVGAATGPVTLTQADGQFSMSAPVDVAAILLPGPADGLIATAVTARKTFLGGRQVPTLAYRLGTETPAAVTVSVVRAQDGTTVESFDEGVVEPGEARAVSWGARPGRYRFVVDAEGRDPAESAGFEVHAYRFPLEGPHDYGDGLGAGRGHQGTDVFAACGTPVVAARGGVVKFEEFEGRAGHYLVVDEAGSGFDSAYMHLRAPALAEAGERVRTGQLLGNVGQTGAASECHLHFERWTAPGWYSGGRPVDAMSHLKAWDRSS